MKKIGFLFLLAACAFVACSDNDTPEEQPAAKRLLTVEVSENPLTDEATGAPALGITRTDNITTTGSLNKFYINYEENDHKPDYTFEKDNSGTWIAEGPRNWPENVENNDKIDFYAYTGGDFNYSEVDPYVSFEVDGNASSQHDLLVAENKVAYSDDEGKVSLSFDHACAVVQFKVQLTNTLYGNLNSSNLTVNSIVLQNVNKEGRYHYATPSWTLLGEPSSFKLTNSSITVGTELQELPCGYLFMIPQSREANGTEGTYLEVNYSAEKTPANIPLTINWQAGYLYTINIRLGTNLIKE